MSQSIGTTKVGIRRTPQGQRSTTIEKPGPGILVNTIL
jgi:hypothetical protein